MKRTVRVVVALAAAVTFLAAAPQAQAKPVAPQAATYGPCPGCHWGPNPYLSVPSSDPYYRSVALIDNTGDPSLSAWIQLWAQQMNDVRNASRPAWPVFLYYQNIIFGGTSGNYVSNGVTVSQPECNVGPTQYLVICKRQPAYFPTQGLPAATTAGLSGPYTAGAGNHTLNARVNLSTIMDSRCAYDKQNVVYHEVGHTLALGHSNPDSASVMYDTLLGGCVIRGYTGGDVGTLDSLYNHQAG